MIDNSMGDWYNGGERGRGGWEMGGSNKGARNRVSLNDQIKDNPEWTYHTRKGKQIEKLREHDMPVKGTQ